MSNKQKEAGVRVSIINREELTVPCAKEIYSQLGKLGGVLQCDFENALNNGKCAQ